MAISVFDLKERLLDVLRQVEHEGTAIDIEWHGEVVARIVPVTARSTSLRPWAALRGSGTLLAAPEESVLKECDFSAGR